MASKKSKTKPPRGRPVSTSHISQPAVEDSSFLTVLSSFSSNGNLFAFVSLAVDKHCLRVYDTTSVHSVAEHIVDSAKITALTWSNVDLLDGQQPSDEDDIAPPLKKKRKKRSSRAADASVQENGVETVLLGLSNGKVSLFSPTHGRILRTFSHATSTSAILSAVMTNSENGSPTIWTSSADGAIRVWHAQKNDMLGSWKNDDRMPYSSMAIRPGFAMGEEGGRVDMVVANHGIHLLSTTSIEPDAFESRKPKKLASFTGHASSVTGLHWDASQNPPNRFLSTAEGDRFVYVWEVPDDQTGPVKDGKLAASIPLDSYARCISLSVSSVPSTSVVERQTLLTVSASGKISVFPIPSELTHPASSKKTPHKVPTLLPRSTICLTFQKVSTATQVVAASFLPQEIGQIRVATIVGGARPVFNIIKYLDGSGDFIQDLNIICDNAAVRLVDESQMAAPNKRYTEPSSLAVQSGVELGQSQEMDNLPSHGLDGDLDVDLAELSLGQRLTALSGPDGALGGTITSDSDNEAATQPSMRKRKNKEHDVPANSLTRTLIQALHSSDSGLLEMCLAHSDPSVIRNTLRRLPPQLAIPLINACVERLGRGARAGNMKGRGGGASSQRGTALIGWVKAILAIHSGHLMTMPDLVARLSNLHAILTTRLSLHESLLSLSGRLDMVLSQIEMRSSVAPAPLTPRVGKKSSNLEKDVVRYVEGESEEEEEQMQVDIEKDSGDEASVEDVELGGDSQDEESAENSEEENSDGDSEDGSSDGEGPSMNGFIDDEAEEYTDEEDEDSE